MPALETARRSEAVAKFLQRVEEVHDDADRERALLDISGLIQFSQRFYIPFFKEEVIPPITIRGFLYRDKRKVARQLVEYEAAAGETIEEMADSDWDRAADAENLMIAVTDLAELYEDLVDALQGDLDFGYSGISPTFANSTMSCTRHGWNRWRDGSKHTMRMRRSWQGSPAPIEMSPKPKRGPNPKQPPASLNVEIGADWMCLLTLSEADLEIHEEAVNAHNRNSMTIRGFAITAVAALVAATYASGNAIPAVAGGIAAVYLALLDWGYTLLHAKTESRIRVLNSLGRSYRRLAARPARRRPQEIKKFQGDLRAYSRGPAVPRELDLRQELRSAFRQWWVRLKTWRQKSGNQPSEIPRRTDLRPGFGSFRWYLPLYVALSAVAALTAITAHGPGNQTIILCRAADEIAAVGRNLKTENCSPDPAQRRTKKGPQIAVGDSEKAKP